MCPINQACARLLALRIPVLVVVLAFTAIPAEVRRPEQALAKVFDTRLHVTDIIANIAGYLPVGAVLAPHLWRTVGVATVVSALAEATQLFTKGRSSSLLDIATNVFGAVLGWTIAKRWKFLPVRISITRRCAIGTLTAAIAVCFIGSRVTPRDMEGAVTFFVATLSVAGLPTNSHGASSPGTLESHWEFDTNHNDKEWMVVDASDNGVSGVLVSGPFFVDGVRGRALRLNGIGQYADFGQPRVLRLTGSLTIAAWINASSFPADDAAIVSNLSSHELGYQLDTTVDRGRRTIGFKLGNARGRLMARYGRTALNSSVWYHVAGVYDARAKTLNVYLNGQLDNGCQLGTITAAQAVSPLNVYVGRRGSGKGFEFAGSIDDVRLYSRALSQDEIYTDLVAPVTAEPVPRLATSDASHNLIDSNGSDAECPPADAADARTAGVIVGFGVLAAITCVGLWPTGKYRLPSLIFSLAVGFLFAFMVAPTLPGYYRQLVPILTLAGGASVVVSMRSERTSNTIQSAERPITSLLPNSRVQPLRGRKASRSRSL